MTTYTSRTLAYLRDQGFTCDVVERWLPNPKHPGGGVRRDFLGLADIIAIGPRWLDWHTDPDTPQHTIAVQSTGPNGHAQHKRDMLANENLQLLIDAGWEVWLVSWRKLLVKRGGKARRWQPRIEKLNPQRQETNR